ncbi:mycobacterial-type methylenetetrahydrofolate reductase, partial [Mycolicibacterium smegmatis]|uniref:mycobacterial-type methylenetetrahydrofolate reductase n=1 Tax=Mycolicibacterium smegmatis TaxID=1772 RepID=UPI0023DA160A
TGIEGRIRHVMIPGMIDEDDDRPIEMKPKMDVLEYWNIIRPDAGRRHRPARGRGTWLGCFLARVHPRQELARLLAHLQATR